MWIVVYALLMWTLVEAFYHPLLGALYIFAYLPYAVYLEVRGDR